MRDADPEQLRADLGPAGGELTRASAGPHGGGRRPARATSAVDVDAERHRLHTAVTQLLTAVSERSPVLLVLEDAHWADVPTLLLLRHLVRTGASARLLVVVTFRDAEADVPAPLAETVVDVSRSEGVTRMRLGGLSDAEVAEFVRLATGPEAGPEVTAAIGSLTGGNAFLLTELWRELVDTGAVEVDATTVRLARPVGDIGTPETVREVVTQRLARLGPATDDRAGARRDGRRHVRARHRPSRLPDLEESALLDATDEAERSGLVTEAPGRRLAYRFAHELVRRSVLDRVSASRRAEMHARRGAGAGEQPAPRRRAWPGGGARPSLRRGGSDRRRRPRRLVQPPCRQVGGRAALAFDEAVDRLRTALVLGLADPRERGTVCLELGDVCSPRRPLDRRARRVPGDGVRSHESLDDRELLARAAIGFEEACWRPGDP